MSTFMFNLSRGLPPVSIKSIFIPMGDENRSNNYIQDKYKYAYLKQQVPSTLIRNWESVKTADKNLIYKEEKGSKCKNKNATKVTSTICMGSSCLLNFKKSLTQQFMAGYPKVVRCKSDRCNECGNP